jgi:hypothetical protein
VHEGQECSNPAPADNERDWLSEIGRMFCLIKVRSNGRSPKFNGRRQPSIFNRWHEPDDARVSSPDL